MRDSLCCCSLSKYSSTSLNHLSVLFCSILPSLSVPSVLYAPVSPHASHRTVPAGSAHPTPPTTDQIVTKHRPQNHIFAVCQGREFFSSPFSQRMSVIPVARQHAFGTHCVKAINSLASFLGFFLLLQKEFLSINSGTWQALSRHIT